MHLIEKKRNKQVSEIEKIITSSEKLTIDELLDYLKSRFVKDFGILKRLVYEQKERFDKVRNNKEIQQLLEKVMSLYEDLIEDKYLIKTRGMFKQSPLQTAKNSQARKDASSYLTELEEKKESNYKVIFRNWNRFYTIEYEMLIQTYLLPLAKKINKRKNVKKGRVLESLSKYKEGKHIEVFRCLIPQIRNSIQHADYVINPKEPIITFYDRKKSPLSVSLDDYYKIVWESFFLTLAFDIAVFDLEFGIYEYIIRELDFLQEYGKKHNLKFISKKEAPLSLLDWALLIKSKKYKQ